ncbi:MAG TPA: dioxygenase [Candidatus Dietzia intestinigallinarum]|nr:dioxygenase [Candidatus Dietzia intestinigallinarum]
MFRSRRSQPDAHAAGADHGVHEHDLGLGHDLAVMNRRAALRGLFGVAGVGAVGLAVGCTTEPGPGSTTAGATTAGSTTTAATAADECVAAAPGETAGPYPGDGSNGPNVLIESGVHRSDITSSFGGMTGTAEGVPMHLTMDLQDLTNNCAAGAGMAVYVWQCDREGRYSLYSEGITDQNYLRGVQTADESGRVEFTSIFPACYSGRWPHIHFEVYDTLAAAVAGENARLTSQIALPADVSDAVYAHDSGYSASIRNMAGVSLESDMVFADGWDAQMPTVTGSPETGYEVAITIGVAAKEDNEASMPAGPGGGGPGGGGPGGEGMPPGGGGPGGGPGGEGMPPGPPPGGDGAGAPS